MKIQTILQLIWLIVMTETPRTVPYELGWSTWSSCSVSCGLGSTTKTRTCIEQPCPTHELSQTQTSQCSMPECFSTPENVSENQPPKDEPETLSPIGFMKKDRTTVKFIPTKRTLPTSKRGTTTKVKLTSVPTTPTTPPTISIISTIKLSTKKHKITKHSTIAQSSAKPTSQIKSAKPSSKRSTSTTVKTFSSAASPTSTPTISISTMGKSTKQNQTPKHSTLSLSSAKPTSKPKPAKRTSTSSKRSTSTKVKTFPSAASPTSTPTISISTMGKSTKQSQNPKHSTISLSSAKPTSKLKPTKRKSPSSKRITSIKVKTFSAAASPTSAPTNSISTMGKSTKQSQNPKHSTISQSSAKPTSKLKPTKRTSTSSKRSTSTKVKTFSAAASPTSTPTNSISTMAKSTKQSQNPKHSTISQSSAKPTSKLKTTKRTSTSSKRSTSTKVKTFSAAVSPTSTPTNSISTMGKSTKQSQNPKHSTISQSPASAKSQRKTREVKRLTVKTTSSTTTASRRTRKRRSGNRTPVTQKPVGNNDDITEKPTTKKNDESTCSGEEKHGIWWPQTEPGKFVERTCPPGSKGTVIRQCLQKTKVKWGPVNLSKCVSNAFVQIKEKLDKMRSCNNSSRPDCIQEDYSKVLQALVNETLAKENQTRMNGGDLIIAVDSMAIIHNNSIRFDTQTSKGFVDIVSNLLTDENTETWIQAQEGNQRNLALEVVTLLEDIGFAMAKTLTNTTTGSILVPAVNVAMKVDHIDTKQPNLKPLYFEFRNTSVKIPMEVFEHNNSSRIVTIIYPTLGHVLKLHKPRRKRRLVTEEAAGLRSSAAVVSSSVLPRRGRKKLINPLTIILTNQQSRFNGVKITCVSWTPGSLQQTWSHDGCSVVPGKTDYAQTACECYHMTLFAALMDPYGVQIPEDHLVGLEMISLVGCSISFVAVVATFCITVYHWKKLKSPKSEILLNICVSIGAVCILVMVEKPARDNKIACSLVAILLHYFLLSVFSWMLCEGLLLRIVFFKDITGSGRSKLRQFYLLGWGFPVIIVSISVGSTQFHGYGKVRELCWLSTENGLGWAFIAPASCVIVLNTWVLVLVMKRMLRIRHIKNKPRIKRLWLGLRAAVVILPLLGTTWLFGLLAFDSNTVAFKYLFAIFNSLQGLMIFIFHCVLDSKVKEAIRSRHRRRQSMAMSVTRVRPAGKDDDNESPIAPIKFFAAKTSVRKDLSEKWDDLWAKHQTRVKNANQQHEAHRENDCPQSLRMASLLFETTPQMIDEHNSVASIHDRTV